MAVKSDEKPAEAPKPVVQEPEKGPAKDAAEASAREKKLTVKIDDPTATVSIAPGVYQDGDKVSLKEAAELKLVPGVEVTD